MQKKFIASLAMLSAAFIVVAAPLRLNAQDALEPEGILTSINRRKMEASGHQHSSGQGGLQHSFAQGERAAQANESCPEGEYLWERASNVVLCSSFCVSDQDCAQGESCSFIWGTPSLSSTDEVERCSGTAFDSDAEAPCEPQHPQQGLCDPFNAEYEDHLAEEEPDQTQLYEASQRPSRFNREKESRGGGANVPIQNDDSGFLSPSASATVLSETVNKKTSKSPFIRGRAGLRQ